MQRIGTGTRFAMVVVGTVWCAVGGLWLYLLDPTNVFSSRDNAWILVIPTALLCGGLVLAKTGLKPTPPKTFEDEIPDAHPDLEGPTDLD